MLYKLKILSYVQNKSTYDWIRVMVNDGPEIHVSSVWSRANGYGSSVKKFNSERQEQAYYSKLNAGKIEKGYHIEHGVEKTFGSEESLHSYLSNRYVHKVNFYELLRSFDNTEVETSQPPPQIDLNSAAYSYYGTW